MIQVLVLGPPPRASRLPVGAQQVGWPENAADLPSGKRPYDRVLAASPPGERWREDMLAGLQERLRPGGELRATVSGRRAAMRLRRRLDRYFDGGPPRNGQRFRRVGLEREGAGLWRLRAFRPARSSVMGHFDDLAGEYRAELPEHVVDHYLERKLARILGAVGANRGLGLDLGCGVGQHARIVARRTGGRMVAVDASTESLTVARGAQNDAKVLLSAADGQRLPFAAGSFDFAYTINMLHHLKRGEQERCVAEVFRVLRPDAPLVVLEINTRNPIFRLYMRKVFPRRHRIDRGDEEFIAPRRWPLGTPFVVESVRGFTFLPDFTPRWLLPAARPLERALEATPLRGWGIHYAAVLRKPKEVAA